MSAPIRWVRFKEFVTSGPNDYYYLNTMYWCAMVFIPKRDVVFHGFGLFANPDGKDV